MGSTSSDLMSRYPAAVACDVRQTIAMDVPADKKTPARRWTRARWRLQHPTTKALSAVPGVDPGVVQTTGLPLPGWEAAFRTLRC